MAKTIIVTGANGNLGSAVVKKMAEEGYTVVAVVEPGKKLDAAAVHKNIDVQEADLTNEAEADVLIRKITDKYKTIHAALMLVGGYAPGTVENTAGETLTKMYSLNFETAYFTARPVFKQMIKQNGGRLVFIGARTALKPSEGKNSLAYALSKSLIFTLAENLNAEGAYRNVVSTVIVPSTLDTPANRKSMPKADPSQWVKTSEVASLIAFLLSDDANALREPVLKMYGRS